SISRGRTFCSNSGGVLDIDAPSCGSGSGRLPGQSFLLPRRARVVPAPARVGVYACAREGGLVGWRLGSESGEAVRKRGTEGGSRKGCGVRNRRRGPEADPAEPDPAEPEAGAG